MVHHRHMEILLLSRLLALACGFLVIATTVAQRKFTDNIDGTFKVAEGRHYSNKTTLTWGQNGERSWSVFIRFSRSCAGLICLFTEPLPNLTRSFIRILHSVQLER